MLVTPEFMRELLHLPSATEILGSGQCHGQVEVFVTHPDLEDVPFTRLNDERPPLIQPTFQRREPVVFVDWGQGK